MLLYLRSNLASNFIVFNKKSFKIEQYLRVFDKKHQKLPNFRQSAVEELFNDMITFMGVKPNL